MFDYSDGVKEHALNPRNVGLLENADGVGTEGTPGSGPFMEISVQIRCGVVSEIAFRTYGCGAAIASCSKLTDMVKGKPASEALSVTPAMLLEALGGLPLGKRHCPEMAISALRKALIGDQMGK